MISKEEICNVIKEAELKAYEITKLEVEMDFSELERKSISNDHLKEQLSIHISNTINNYNSIRSLYKHCNETYLSLASWTDVLTKEDRIDFIAMTLFESIDKSSYSKTNLSEEVFEVRSAELKSLAFTEYLRGIENQMSDARSTEIKSFRWVDTKTNAGIDLLHKTLIEKDWIYSPLTEFKKLFLHTDNFNPVEWIHNPGTLAYLIHQLIENKIVLSHYPKWKKTKICFSVQNINMAQIVSQINSRATNLLDKVEIDNLIKSILHEVSASPSTS